MLEDWILADALYRSRCLELPHAGIAMVPGLDMANHSPKYLARYDETPEGDVILLPSSGSGVSSGEEITISYGEAKSAAEMLFSYGFIDQESGVKELALHLDALPDDPLGKAKFRIYKGPPIVRLSLTEDRFQWYSPFLYLLILNEEDGLAFRVVQDMEGGRELRLLWEDEDVTGRTDEFESLIQDHHLCQIFKLRAVAVLEDLVAAQLDRITVQISYGATEQSQAANQPRVECMLAAEKLRDLEAQILQGAAAALENEVSILSFSFALSSTAAWLPLSATFRRSGVKLGVRQTSMLEQGTKHKTGPLQSKTHVWINANATLAIFAEGEAASGRSRGDISRVYGRYPKRASV